jgi:hypothetical protein
MPDFDMASAQPVGFDLASAVPVHEGMTHYTSSGQASRIPDILGRSAILGGIRDAITAPLDAWNGKMQPTLTADEDGNVYMDSPANAHAMNVAGMLMGGGSAAGTLTRTQGGAGTLGATAWHGSPHLFPPEKLYQTLTGEKVYVGGKNALQSAPEGATLLQDFPAGRFRYDAIGTGEGNQAYGHGVAYLAEHPDVAAEYQHAGGALYKTDIPDAHIDKMLDLDKPLSEQHPDVLNAIKNEKIKQIQASEAIRNNDMEFARNNDKNFNESEYKDWLNKQKNKDTRRINAMNMPNDADNGTGVFAAINDADRVSGAEYYRQHLADGSDKDASAKLQAMGIPGIKYLDGSSRTAGEGTRNFVMFNPEDIRILERNGVATGQQPFDINSAVPVQGNQ